jgi:SAM-dependent methyltransferase
MTETFDEVWEERYAGDPAYRNHYPWSAVVTFLLQKHPFQKGREETDVLEIGCGTGNNLWCAAREGFRVSGVDGSQTAIAYANAWFDREELSGDLRVGDFTSLPFSDNSFDLAFDRAAISLTTREGAQVAVGELARVVKPGGRVLLTPYSDRCSSFHKVSDGDGVIRDIQIGSVTGSGGQVRFYGKQEVYDLFDAGWRILSLKHVEETEMTSPGRMIHAEWHVVAERL